MNATDPLVSVVVTSYNYGRFLPGAIDSVLAQTYPNLEIVLVDDGSADDTAEIAANYADSVRYIRQTNQGAARARNTGIAATTGSVVAFLDADDQWFPDKIAKQVAHLRDHPEIGLVSCHAYACDEEMRIESTVHAAEWASRWMLERLLVRNVVLNPTCALVRREALDRVSGFSELKQWEDWDTWLRIAKSYPLGFVPEPLAKVRRHARGLSPKHGLEHLALDQTVFDRHAGAVAQRWKRAVLRRRARSMSYFHVARLVGNEDRAMARRFSVRALCVDPTTLTRRKVGMVVRSWRP